MLACKLFNSLDRVLSVIPFTSLEISLNRLGPLHSEYRISNFHLPSTASRASLIESIAFEQSFSNNIVLILKLLPLWIALSKGEALSFG